MQIDDIIESLFARHKPTCIAEFLKKVRKIAFVKKILKMKIH